MSISDIEEIQERQRENVTRRQSSENRSLNVMVIPNKEVSRKFHEEIKMFTENKVTVENAFSLKIIDLLHSMVTGNRADYTLASIGLDASAKVYACRVDKTYSQVTKMRWAINKKTGGENRNREDHQAATGDNHDENPRRKRKRTKKSKTRILVRNEEISCVVETYDPMSLVRRIVDTQTSDQLLLNQLPCHANTKSSLHKWSDCILDSLPDNPSPAKRFKRALPLLDNESRNQEICSTFHEFEFLNWDANNNNPNARPQVENLANVGLRFDMSADLQSEDDNNAYSLPDPNLPDASRHSLASENNFEMDVLDSRDNGAANVENVNQHEVNGELGEAQHAAHNRRVRTRGRSVVEVIRENRITEERSFSYFLPQFNLLSSRGMLLPLVGGPRQRKRTSVYLMILYIYFY